MNRHNVILLLFVTVALFAVGCKKEGVNENLDPNAQTNYDFMSTKAGSYWHYGSQQVVAYKRFARNRDTVKNGLKYSYYERQEDTGAGSLSPEYFGKNGNKYITLIDLDGSETTYLESVFWIDGSKQGDKWQNTGIVNYPGFGDVKVYTSSDVSETGVTMKSGNETFHDVIHVHSDLRTVTLNTRVGTLDMWILRDVGVIKQEAHINILGFYTVDRTDTLTDYHIEP